ncbi:branched-chain amino acid transaminase, partial [Francisella tularensis subsp. holarctica]|nr:branched-chain amino acid transaminase [Francisella tularensis subsp. holarctica]
CTSDEITPVASIDYNKLKLSEYTITNQIKQVFEKLKQGQVYKEALTNI